eukprot:1319934-Prymnesium_polylepis.2
METTSHRSDAQLTVLVRAISPSSKLISPNASPGASVPSVRERAPCLAHLERARREHVQPIDGVALAEDGVAPLERGALLAAHHLDEAEQPGPKRLLRRLLLRL